jgi:hypothetical protein
MELKFTKGDVFEEAKHVEAMVLWLKSGFNSINTLWMFKFSEMINNAGISKDSTANTLGSNDRVWMSENPTIIKLKNPIGMLKTVYVFPNPTDTFECDSQKIVKMVKDALDYLEINGVKTCVINGIQSLNKEHDTSNAKSIIETVQIWGNENSNSSLVVNLVDLRNGFLQQ